MDILISIVGFVLAVGILVAFHEYGHFWVARRLGVKVLRFSIGFGKPLFTWRGKSGETEYVVATIPLGGYVKMLDEREGAVAEAELDRAFNRKPLATRIAVVAAGPLANFLFAIVAYWAIFVIGSSELRPVVGEVQPQTPAAVAGFERGDELVQVAGSDVRSWEQALFRLLSVGLERGVVSVEVERPDGQRQQRRLDLREAPALGEDPDFLGVIGMRPWMPELPARIGQVSSGSAAERAGLRAGDEILAVDGEPVGDWRDLVAELQPRPGESVSMRVRRDQGVYTLSAELDSVEEGDLRRGVLGVSPHVPSDLYEDMRRTVRYGPLAAVAESVQATWDASALTVKVLWRMVIGDASLKNISGPINIAQYAGDTVSLGLVPFLKFLAIVSISLGILNLLPVPVLDGGHLLYYVIEGVRGRPLSEQAQIIGQQIGIVLLVMLMSLAIYNDLARIFG